jgi:hypothetical protein
VWASDLGFEILGVSYRLQSQDQAVASEMERLWKGWRRPSVAARLRNTFSVVVAGEKLRLYRDCSLLATTATPSDLVVHLLMEANRLAVTRYSGFAAHAAVLASSRRVAAVLGVSGVGKTTLAAASVLAGLAYGSDESLCVDRSTREIVPYPRPLGLSTHSLGLLGLDGRPMYRSAEETPVSVEELGGSILEPRRPLTDIVLPVRSEDQEPGFEPLGPADGAAALLSNSFNHYRNPQGSYELTASLAAECRVWRFTYSDAVASGRALADHLSLMA